MKPSFVMEVGGPMWVLRHINAMNRHAGTTEKDWQKCATETEVHTRKYKVQLMQACWYVITFSMLNTSKMSWAVAMMTQFCIE